MADAKPLANDGPRYCVYCGKPLAAAVRFCGYCGRDILNAAEGRAKTSEPPRSNIGKRRLDKRTVIIAFFLAGLAVVVIGVYESGAPSNRSPQPALTSSEHLRRAEEGLKPGATAAAISEALNQIKAIPESAPEAARAKVVEQGLLTAQKAATAARERARERALAPMVKKRDEVENLTVWQDHSMPAYVNSRSWIGAYIVAPDTGEPSLRFVIYYTSEDWLFIQRYLFKIDGQTFTLTPPAFGNDAVQRDSGERGIWEWWDVSAENDALVVLLRLSSAKASSLRYEGRHYYKDRAISAEEQAAIKRTLSAYLALKPDN